MITRHFRSATVTVLLFAAAGAVIAASAWTMEVRASRGLRLAVVDTRKPSALRDASQRAFGAALASAATRRVGAPLEIAIQSVGAGEARARFGDGRCDAVLVLGGDDRPMALRRIDALTLCGELEPETGARPVYLIVTKDDAALRDLLTEAFANVLADRAALAAIAGAGSGAQLAVIAR